MVNKIPINSFKSITRESGASVISPGVYIPMHRPWTWNMKLYKMQE